jgi:putative RNA 2'-phosphotransferase
MDTKRHTKISKSLSYFLRHKPQEIGLVLEKDGWVRITSLLQALKIKNLVITREELDEVVANCPKKRFTILDGKIRANQGHSTEVQMDFKEVPPRDLLYHGTGEKNVENIFKDGIKKMGRHHVHLSDSIKTATDVGARHGKPVVLAINSKKMGEDGFKFYLSENGVWLTDHVPVEYREHGATENVVETLG